MKTKVMLSILVLILSFSFLSCENRNKKVAVFSLNKGVNVPENIALLVRKAVVDYATNRKKIDALSTELIDQQIAGTGATAMADLIKVGLRFEADIIVVGTIALSTRELNLVDSIKGNTAWYDVEISSINVVDGTVIKSFSGTYDAKMSGMNNAVKKLKLGGGLSWWWVIIGVVAVFGIIGWATEN